MTVELIRPDAEGSGAIEQIDVTNGNTDGPYRIRFKNKGRSDSGYFNWHIDYPDKDGEMSTDRTDYGGMYNIGQSDMLELGKKLIEVAEGHE